MSSKPDEKKDEKNAPDAAPAAKKSKGTRAPGPVPSGEIPMCWVTDGDTPDPYLINEVDFDDSKHTRCT